MLDNSKFPHFIPDRPTGEDVFEGQSQSYLSKRIRDYIKSLDEKPDEKEGANIPRIIGIEGAWGSGKSNVVNMIADQLNNDGYYTFTYDAWGHQEDLQRRSILETLTNELITKNVLTGKVCIQMRNGKDHEATWKEQLSLLLSNKTTTIKHSQPQLSASAVWGIILVGSFAILSVIMGQLIDKQDKLCLGWILIECFPIIIGVFVALFYRFIRHRDRNCLLTLITQKGDNTIDEEYTSSEEPSVMEFQNWIKAISNHIGKKETLKKKIIIVFDNMDRLPSERVMQLWSCIYTFFAGGMFENVWAIIPYDYIHLCQAIYGVEENKGTDRIKRFIDKTFFITYKIPQPIITDYKKLFDTFFEKAFGKNEHDQDHIGQVFMSLNPEPNPRTVISFVNELVSMRLQWADKKYRLQNIALFVLKKEQLFYSEEPLEENLLSDDIFKGIASFYPEREPVRTQLCQFAYGLENEELASELPLRRILHRAIADGNPIKEFSNQANFVNVLNDVLSRDVNDASLDNAVLSLASLDGCELSEIEKEQIKKKWDFLANSKVSSTYEKQKFDNTLRILINHASDKRITDMTKSFCLAIQKCEITDGADYFNALSDLQECLENAHAHKDSDIIKFLNRVETIPNHYAEYILAAKTNYQKYHLFTDNEALNNYLLESTISGLESAAHIVDYIKDDSSYDFSALKEGLASKITANEAGNDIRILAYVNRILSKVGDGVKARFSEGIISARIQSLVGKPGKEFSLLGNEDICAMYLASGKDISNFDSNLLPRLSECFEKYIDYTYLLKHMGSEKSAYRLLNVYIIQNRKGGSLDMKYVSQHILEFKNNFKLDSKTLLTYFNDWEMEDWTEEEIVSYKIYVKQELFEDYKNNPGNFSDSIVSLGVKAMEKQLEGFLIQPASSNQIIIDPFWGSFIKTFLGSNFIPVLNLVLTKELCLMLENISITDRIIDKELLEIMLNNKPEDAILKIFLTDKMNAVFTKSDIRSNTFMVFGNLLPMLGSSMDDHTARGLINHFIKPVYKDSNCAKLIIANKDFYFDILIKDRDISQTILEDMQGDETINSIYEVWSDKIKSFIGKKKAKTDK